MRVKYYSGYKALNVSPRELLKGWPLPKYGRQDQLTLKAKDDTVLTVSGKRYGYFFVHRMPGSQLYCITHIASGIAVVQAIKGFARAKQMAHVILQHELPTEVNLAREVEDLRIALAGNAKLFDVLKEFNANADNPGYDPMQRALKETQTTIFEVIK